MFVRTWVNIWNTQFSKLIGLNFFIEVASFSFGIRISIAKFNLKICKQGHQIYTSIWQKQISTHVILHTWHNLHCLRRVSSDAKLQTITERTPLFISVSNSRRPSFLLGVCTVKLSSWPAQQVTSKLTACLKLTWSMSCPYNGQSTNKFSFACQMRVCLNIIALNCHVFPMFLRGCNQGLAVLSILLWCQPKRRCWVSSSSLLYQLFSYLPCEV